MKEKREKVEAELSIDGSETGNSYLNTLKPLCGLASLRAMHFPAEVIPSKKGKRMK